MGIDSCGVELGQPMMTRLTGMNVVWRLFRAIGAQSSVSRRPAFSKNGAFMGTRLSFMGHWGFCWVAFGWVGRVEVLFLRWSWTSVSLKASASRSVMVIALVQLTGFA